VGATNTALILSQLEGNIQKYKPDMVIVMMGINDSGAHMPQEYATSSKIICFLRNFKTYKLMRLLKMHAVTKIANFIPNYQSGHKEAGPYLFPQSRNKHDLVIKIISPLMSQAYKEHIELGRRYQVQGKIDLAKEEFRRAIAINPQYTDAYFQLAWLSEQKESEELVRQISGILREAIEVKPYDISVRDNYSLLGVNLIDCYAKFVEAEEIFKKILEIYPYDFNAFINLGRCYRGKKEYALSEKMFQKALALGIKEREVFQNLAVLYNEMGNYKLSEEYFKKANELNFYYYCLETINNYKAMKSILDKRKIKLVCVQYPMRSIAPLKNIFAGKKDIIFVDNEIVFKEAVNRSGYKEYFKDNFAGDFGHCTPKGNRLLAENIAKVILKEVFGK
jgi:Tfp pilus assembly protein PilF